MDTSVDFESSLFAPFLPDEAQINPGVFGAELAFWLARQLSRHGVTTSYPFAEDWGWLLEYTTEDDKQYVLCCANRDGAHDKWRCYVQPSARGFFRRPKAPAHGARALMGALREVLAEEPGIRKVAWER